MCHVDHDIDAIDRCQIDNSLHVSNVNRVRNILLLRLHAFATRRDETRRDQAGRGEAKRNEVKVGAKLLRPLLQLLEEGVASSQGGGWD